MKDRSEATAAAARSKERKADLARLREIRRPNVRAWLRAQLEIERAKDEAKRQLEKAKEAIASFGASLDALACAWMAPALKMAPQPRDGRGDAMWRAIVESQPLVGGPNGIDGPFAVPPAELRWIGQMSQGKTKWPGTNIVEPTDADLAMVLYGTDDDAAQGTIRRRRKEYEVWVADRANDIRQAAEGSERAEKRMRGRPPRRSPPRRNREG